MNLHLLRHGKTTYNRDSLGLGRMDVGLTRLGEAQSLAAARRLAREPITRVFSSPLRRARFMADEIAAARGIEVEIRDELIEMDVGHTEGLTYAAMHERHADFMRAWTRPGFETVRMPGGESLAGVAERLRPFAADLRALDEPAVAVVSHNFITKLLICELLGLQPAAFRAVAVDVASMCTFVLRNGRVSVAALNDSCHLDSLNVNEETGSLST
ncbi:MAG: histidine phosphatase family protein [Hyphomicrobiales bacterium]